MNAQTLLRTAIVLLALTGLGGLLMAGIRFSGKPHPPSPIAMLHGLLAASGLTLILYAAFAAGIPGAAWAGLILLLLAAAGGLILNLRYHWQGQALPMPLMLVHAAVAVIGLVVLAIAGWNVPAG
jgi:hypothetical protein